MCQTWGFTIFSHICVYKNYTYFTFIISCPEKFTSKENKAQWKHLMQVAPGAQVRESSARGLQGFLLGVTLASGTSEPRGAGGGRPAGAPMGCGGAQKTGHTPGLALGQRLAQQPWEQSKERALLRQEQAGLSSQPRWRDTIVSIPCWFQIRKSQQNHIGIIYHSLIKQQLLIQYK